MSSDDEGSIPFGPIVVHLPDASLTSFWFAHDLAGVFGLDFNSEAEARLKEELRRRRLRGVELDHEADAVTVEARTPAAMMGILGALIACAPERFAGVDLAAIEARLRAWKRPKAARFAVGDVVAVPLFGGRLAASQILACPPGLGVLLLHLDLLADDRAALEAALARGEGEPMAASATTSEDVASGAWPVVTSRPIPATVDVAALATRESRRSGGPISLLESCLGVAPWEMYRPDEHDPYVLGTPPRRRRSRRTIFEHRLREVFPAAPVAPRDGPATLHVLLAWRGNSPTPPLHELPRLYRMREALTALGGSVPPVEACSGGGFDGFFDVFAHVDDVARAQETADCVAEELRATRDAVVETFPRFAFDWRGTLDRMR